jgi:hypothetical protein
LDDEDLEVIGNVEKKLKRGLPMLKELMMNYVNVELVDESELNEENRSELKKFLIDMGLLEVCFNKNNSRSKFNQS